MATRRERLEARAARRRAWGESAERKADAAYDGVRAIADGIPMGQPILVGHHSEGRARRDQARMHSGMDKSVEESKKAVRHGEAAESIDRQLATSIFDDDENAVEALRAKAARLEAERDEMKAANATYRAAHRAELAAKTPYERSEAIPFPSYSISNIGARIRDARKRADALEREQAVVAAGGRGPGRSMLSRYPGVCADCGGPIERDARIVWYRLTKEAVHADCQEGATT